MIAKVFLSEVKNKRDKILEEQETIQRLRDTLEVSGISYDRDSIQTSPNLDRMSCTFSKIFEHEDYLEELKQEYAKLRILVIDMISRLDVENHRKVLNYVYLDYMTLKHTARKMGYSYDYVRELHSKALDEFSEKFPQ